MAALRSYFCCLRKSVEGLTIAPHAVQQNGEFAGDGDDGSLLSAFASRSGQLQTPVAQRGIGAETTQNILRRLHQQTAQTLVASLGNAFLRVRIARLTLRRTQTEEGARRAVAGRIGLIEREHVSGSDDRSHAGSGAQKLDLRIRGPAFLNTVDSVLTQV